VLLRRIDQVQLGQPADEVGLRDQVNGETGCPF
jgi:hypothetical protein